jgi:hypothetical protein
VWRRNGKADASIASTRLGCRCASVRAAVVFGELVEFAGTLPGGWTDHPAVVQPVLAALARQVNDMTSDDGRMALLPWAAWLIGTAGAGVDESLDGILAVQAGAAALHHADIAAAARIAPAMAGLAWPAVGRAGRLRQWWRATVRRRDALRAVHLAVTAAASTKHPDDALRDLLAGAVDVVRRRQGLPTITVSTAGYRTWPRTQAIEVELRLPEGSESFEDYCTALPDQSLAALSQAWTARAEELRRCDSNWPRSG